MSVSFAQMRTESAYDALLEGMPILLTVMKGPRTADELVADGVLDSTAGEKQLVRLTRAGLLRKNGARYEAIADVIEQTRQEGIITSISHHVLPLVTRLASDEGTGFAVQLDLDVPPAEQASLWSGRILPLLQAVDEVSRDAGADAVPCMALAIGTSDVPAGLSGGDRLIETVRRAARQRSTPGEADRAILVEYHGLFAPDRVVEAEALVRSAAGDLGGRAVRDDGKRPAYAMALVFCARASGRAGSAE